MHVLSPKYSRFQFFFSPPAAGLTNRGPVRDSDPGAPLCAGQIFAGKINFKFVAAVPILSSTLTPPKPSGSSNNNGYSLVFLPYLHLRVLSLIQPCIYQTLVLPAAAEPISSSSSDSDLHDLRDYPQEALNRVGFPFPTPLFISCHALISSATIIEFPATSSLFIFVVFATSLFRAFGGYIFCDQFLVELSGSICLFGVFFLGLNLCVHI